MNPSLSYLIPEFTNRVKKGKHFDCLKLSTQDNYNLQRKSSIVQSENGCGYLTRPAQAAAAASLGQRGVAGGAALPVRPLLRPQPRPHVPRPDRAQDRDEHRHRQGEELRQGTFVISLKVVSPDNGHIPLSISSSCVWQLCV